MSTRKIVFFVPPDRKGCHLLKGVFQNKFGMVHGPDEGLMFDYISHKVNATSMDLKIYLVPDLEKYKKIRPLYFKNVDIFVLVFDLAEGSVATWKKISEDLKLHQSKSQMVFLGYKEDDKNVRDDVFDYITHCKGIYLEFSGESDLEHNIEFLFDNWDEPRTQKSPGHIE